MTIGDNVVAGLKLNGMRVSKSDREALIEECLTRGGLWNEVKDRLDTPGGALSGGQQQRLCIARSLAVRPEVLLMDEPCSALDPTSTRRVEETIAALASEVTIVIVTHNMQQADRVSQQCAFFLAEQGTPGFIVESGDDAADLQRAAGPADGRLRERALRVMDDTRRHLAMHRASTSSCTGLGRQRRFGWRLLSGNNRDMGRGVVAYRDAEACGAGIREILRRLDELDPVFIPDGGNAWRWFLRYKGEPIVSSGHAYDRKIRCKEGQLQFLRHAPDAQIKGDIVVSTARRWSASAVIDLRDPVDYRASEPPALSPSLQQRSSAPSNSVSR